MNKDLILHDVKIRENVLLRNVYGWMLLGLVITAAVSYAASTSQVVLRYITLNPVGTIFLFIAQIVVVFMLSGRIERLQPGTAIALFIGYSALTGLSLSSIFLAYAEVSITMAFVSAAIAFAAAAIWGTFTKKNISGWSRYLMMALFGLLGASLISLFLRSSLLDLGISVIGVGVFTALAAWDAQKIASLNASYGTQMTSEELTKVGIIGALDMYLDFINIFLYLLRIFSNRDN